MSPITLYRLPPELILLIASHLPTPALSILTRTSHTLRALLNPLLITHFTSQATGILWWALHWNKLDILKRAISHGADVNDWNEGTPPLTYAVHQGTVDAARMLIAAGARMERREGTHTRSAQTAGDTNDLGTEELLMWFGAMGPFRPGLFI